MKRMVRGRGRAAERRPYRKCEGVDLVEKMTGEQRKQIYGIAIDRGIYEKGNPDDALHDLVRRETGKGSLSELTAEDARKVIKALGGNVFGKREVNNGADRGMATEAQKKKVWAMMFQLQNLSPGFSSVAARLGGVIEKYLGVSSFEKDPFRFVNSVQCHKLIEVLKKMIETEERKGVRS